MATTIMHINCFKLRTIHNYNHKIHYHKYTHTKVMHVKAVHLLHICTNFSKLCISNITKPHKTDNKLCTNFDKNNKAQSTI